MKIKSFIVLIFFMALFVLGSIDSLSAAQRADSPADSTETTVEIKTEPLFRYWKRDGIEEFKQWFSRQLSMPSESMASGTVGEANFSFIVDVDGKVVDLEIESASHPVIASEIQRIMDSSPDWKKPAYDVNDNPQPFLVIVPLKFQLNKAYN